MYSHYSLGKCKKLNTNTTSAQQKIHFKLLFNDYGMCICLCFQLYLHIKIFNLNNDNSERMTII